MSNSIYKIADQIYEQLKCNNYPTVSDLVNKLGCSRSKVFRDLNRLKNEYCWPIEFSKEKNGYYFLNPNFEKFPLLPGYEEFIAFLLIVDIAQTIGSKDLTTSITRFWKTVKYNFTINDQDIHKYLNVFSSDLTQLSQIAELPIYSMIKYAAEGEVVTFNYKSPWKSKGLKAYVGTIKKIHFSDGTFYIYFISTEGRKLILNAYFIKELEISKEFNKREIVEEIDELQWLEGFGVWSAEKIHNITIVIKSPASEYYATQTWHDEQEDLLNGSGELIRQFPSMLSPELVRRILSLGKHVARIEPPELNVLVKNEARALLKSIG